MRWAQANSNLALVKYWGKAPGFLDQAAAGSISVTLEDLATIAGVELDESSTGPDEFDAPHQAWPRLQSFVDAVRDGLGIRARAHVRVRSSFPVAAGLASSASTFAALAVALAAAADRERTITELARLARAGSGSACRSVPGGWVEWIPGADPEVERIAGPGHWPLAIVIAIVSEAPKSVGSREGMARTSSTSPYYAAWLASGSADLAPVREAILGRDLERLGSLAERNAFRMHAAALAADPPLLYWQPGTVACLHEVARLRDSGIGAWASIDAGPQVKILCDPADAASVATRIASVPGVARVMRSRPGGPARLLDGVPAWAEPRTRAEAS